MMGLMAKRSPYLDRLPQNYLFDEIAKRTRAFQDENPKARLISLGIGDTTEPLPFCVTEELKRAAVSFGTKEGYRGYGEVEGDKELRKRIQERFYPASIDPDEVFISDGAKCDIARLQFLFGKECRVGVQDPAYPVYLDASVLGGQNAPYLLPCTPENDFFPDLSNVDLDLLYFCSPNNPTGAVATRSQLQTLVAWAKKRGAIIVYDTAYSAFIQDPNLPRSIYEIEGAKEVAIETGSFSKLAGFTGLRLGWTLVPRALKFADSTSVYEAWRRIVATTFNGSCRLVQAGGCALLTDEGLKEARSRIALYLDNAHILRSTLQEQGIPVYGGEHAPYLWAHFQQSSWEAFDRLLTHDHLITTPGVGFGPSGEGFIRLSAFGSKEDIAQAALRLLALEEAERV